MSISFALYSSYASELELTKQDEVIVESYLEGNGIDMPVAVLERLLYICSLAEEALETQHVKECDFSYGDFEIFSKDRKIIEALLVLAKEK